MDRFEKDIREKLSHYEEEPPVHVWDAIEIRLDKKEYRGWFWLKIAASLILLVITAASLIWVLPGLKQSDVVVELPAPEPLPGSTTEAPTPAAETTPGVLPVSADPILAFAADPIPDQPVWSATRAGLPAASLQSVESHQAPRPIPAFDLAALEVSMPAGLAAPSAGKDLLLSQEQTPMRLLALETSEEPAGQVWGLTAFLSPQQSYRLQTNATSIPFEALENQIMGFSAGLHVSYRLGKRMELRTGAAYNLIGQQINDIAAFSHPSMTYLYSTKGEKISSHPQSMSTSMGGINFTDQSFYFADIASTRIFTLKGSYDESNVNLLNKSAFGLVQHFGFLEVPVMVHYELLRSIINVSVKSGFSANLLVNNHVYLQGSAYRNPIGESTGIARLSLSGTGGLALSYPVSPRMDLSLEPTFSMFITPIHTQNNMQTHPYNYALFMGMKYNF